jgi:hypothetical protein
MGGLGRWPGMTSTETFRDPPVWPDPLNYDKRIRNLSDRVAELELAIEQLRGKNADDARSKWRGFRWGGWK